MYNQRSGHQNRLWTACSVSCQSDLRGGKALNPAVKKLTSLMSVLALTGLLVLPVLAADSAKSLYNKGRDAEARQDYEQAYEYFRQAFQKEPKQIKYRVAFERTRFLASASHVHRGQILRDGGKLQEALAEFQKGVDIDPSSFIAQQEMQRTKKMIEEGSGGGPQPQNRSSNDLISRMVDRAAGPVELQPVSQTPLTLNVSEDAKRVYTTIGQLAGINVLFDPEFGAKPVSVQLNGVTLAEALNIVALESHTFWRPVTANTIYVAADSPAKRRELEQNVLKTFYLSNLNQATELQEIINTFRGVLEMNHIQPIQSQNAIVVRGTPAQVALAEKLVRDFDKARAEIIVDVVFMQVSRDKLRDLGVQPPSNASIGLQSNVTTPTTTTTPGSTTTTTTTTTTPSGTTGQINLNSFANLNATNFLVTLPSMTANFLFSDSNTHIIQRPQIRASDGQQATLKIGDSIPVATGSFQPGIGGVGINPLVNTQFQYQDVGVKIIITPTIHSLEREVTLKMNMEISSVTNQVNIGGINQPVIGQRTSESIIRLKDGEVNIIGGILEEQDVQSLSGVPGLAQIPFFKYLFSTTHKERTNNEIVMAVIPHIVRAQELNEVNLRPVDVGTAQTIEMRTAAPTVRMNPTNGNPGAGANTAAPANTSPAPTTPPTGGAGSTAAQPQGEIAQPASGSAPNNPATPDQTKGGTVLWFDPTSVAVAAGQTFMVNVNVKGGQNLFSVTTQLQYDPNVLQLANVSNASLLSRDGQVVVLSSRGDASSGSLTMTAARPGGAGGISGDGPVFTLTFLAKSAGRTTLSLPRAGAHDPANGAIDVSVTPAQVVVR